MKKTLLILVVLMLIKPVLPVLDYIANYEYISTKLCENIERPQLKCNGKCHLAKELAKASESEKPLNSDKKHTFKFEIEVLLCEVVSKYNIAFLTFESKTNDSSYQNFYTSEVSTSVFHPPTHIC